MLGIGQFVTSYDGDGFWGGGGDLGGIMGLCWEYNISVLGFLLKLFFVCSFWASSSLHAASYAVETIEMPLMTMRNKTFEPRKTACFVFIF